MKNRHHKDRSRGLNPRPPGCSTEGVAPLHTAPPVPVNCATSAGPFLVLERSLHCFKLQVGSRIETVSTHRLKPCHTPEDTQAALPPRRGRPPAAAVKQTVARHKLSVSRQQKRVSFADPVASFVPPPLRPPPAPPDSAARLRRSTPRPARYTA